MVLIRQWQWNVWKQQRETVDLIYEKKLIPLIGFQSEYNGNVLANASAADGDKKTISPLYSFSKIMERISPEKSSPDRHPHALRGVRPEFIYATMSEY